MSLVPGFYNHFYQLGKFLSVFIYIARQSVETETGQQCTVNSAVVRPPTQSNLLLFADFDCFSLMSEPSSLLIKADCDCDSSVSAGQD